MICPHCKEDISNDLIARHFASMGGKAGGAKGGRSRSEAKISASKENIKKAHAARKKAKS